MVLKGRLGKRAGTGTKPEKEMGLSKRKSRDIRKILPTRATTRTKRSSTVLKTQKEEKR